MDEPSASLDIYACKRLALALKEIKSQGKTIIIFEHRLWWLNQLADRIVHIENGKVAHDWSAQEFSKLSYKNISNLGLRAWTLDDPDITKNLTCASQVKNNHSSSSSLIIKNLTIEQKPDRRVLSKVNLEIKPGIATALIGKNGAGKTTLARAISGIINISSGSIMYKDAEVGYKSRPTLSYLIMQEPGYQLFADSVIDELHDAAAGKNKDTNSLFVQEQIQTVLKRFSLTDLEDRHPLSLSGGERQRLSIACAVLFNAPFVIFDEPTSGLDAYHMKELVEQIEILKSQGIGILIISHDFEFICASCNQIAHLSKGSISDVYDLTTDKSITLKNQLLDQIED